MIISINKSQKFNNIKFYAKNTIKKTCLSYIIKLFIKIKDRKNVY